MSQIRFNIGVPRGGSAARSAENDAEPRAQSSMRPQGGSAARAAEERNRLEGTPARRSVTIGLRAQGGRTASDAASTGDPTDASATVTRPTPGTASTPAPLTLSGSPALPAAPRSADPIAEDPTSIQPPLTVTARIQSLAKSLFHSGGSSTKPN